MPPGDERRDEELFGLISVPVSEAHQLADPLMLTTCKNALVSLIAVVEEYLRDICRWVFEKRPETFKSKKQIILTHESIIEFGNYDALMNMLLNRILEDVSRDNVAESFRNLLRGRLGWDIKALGPGMVTLKDVSATRNVIIHNQSMINETFIAIVSKPEDYKLGQSINVGPLKLKDNAYAIIELMSQIDEMAVKKCGE